MTSLARAIVRLYPRAWRDRYGPEVLDLISSRRLRMSDVGDLGRGVLDAWLHPQPSARLGFAGGEPTAAVASPVAILAASQTSGMGLYGAVAGTPGAALSRRRFLRRMVGAGIGLLSLEFIGGTIAFLWPPPADGVGVEHEVGTLDDIAGLWPSLARRHALRVPPGARFPGQRSGGHGDGTGRDADRHGDVGRGPARAMAQVPASRLHDPGGVRGAWALPVPLPPEHLQHHR